MALMDRRRGSSALGGLKGYFIAFSLAVGLFIVVSVLREGVMRQQRLRIRGRSAAGQENAAVEDKDPPSSVEMKSDGLCTPFHSFVHSSLSLDHILHFFPVYSLSILRRTHILE